jgi:hypothetical protein
VSADDQELNAPMTVGEALRQHEMLVAQAVDQAYRAAELQISEAERQRGVIEDLRSHHRNLNRAYVLLVGLTIAIIWPPIATALFKSTYDATFASALGYLGDLGVTMYALKRRY